MVDCCHNNSYIEIDEDGFTCGMMSGTLLHLPVNKHVESCHAGEIPHWKYPVIMLSVMFFNSVAF